MKAYARQGEILFFELPDGMTAGNRAKLIPNGVIREGEKEGHEHKADGGQLKMFDESNGVIETGNKDVKVTHPEHGPITLKKGKKYAVKVQKEYDPKKHSKNVKD